MPVYFARSDSYIKIGFSRDPVRRLYELQTGSPLEIELVAVMPGGPQLEAGLHERFAAHNKRNEWFFENQELTDFVEFVNHFFPLPESYTPPAAVSEDEDIEFWLGSEIDAPQKGWRLERNSNGYYRWRWQVKDDSGETVTYLRESGEVGYKKGSHYISIHDLRLVANEPAERAPEPVAA